MKIHSMKASVLIGSLLYGTVCVANPQTMEEWEKCRDKAEESVNQIEVGVAGVEAEIETQCGSPPAKEPSALTGAVGMHPYDLVRSKAYKEKFIALTKEKYQPFVERLAVAGGTTLDGDWIVGEGQAAHMGGVEGAAFAINIKTEEVFAAMMEDGDDFRKFGFDSWDAAPPYLKKWRTDNNK